MEDIDFMKLAIQEAKAAPFPFGCVLVKGGKIISTGKSGKTSEFDPTAHSEINAIRTACKKIGSQNLSGTTLYSTCEPCPMCFTACWWANIDRIVFGISLEDSSKLFVKEVLVSCEYLNEKGGNRIKIEGGILKEDILNLF